MGSITAVFDSTTYLLTSMTCGHPLSDDLRLALICMGTQLSLEDVAKYSGIPTRTVQRLYEEYRQTGSGLCLKLSLETRGAKQLLSYDNIGVHDHSVPLYTALTLRSLL